MAEKYHRGHYFYSLSRLCWADKIKNNISQDSLYSLGGRSNFCFWVKPLLHSMLLRVPTWSRSVRGWPKIKTKIQILPKNIFSKDLCRSPELWKTLETYGKHVRHHNETSCYDLLARNSNSESGCYSLIHVYIHAVQTLMLNKWLGGMKKWSNLLAKIQKYLKCVTSEPARLFHLPVVRRHTSADYVRRLQWRTLCEAYTQP